VTFCLGPFSVALLYTNLWITFLLPKSYVGNVGYVGYRKKSHAKHTACAMTGSYCHYDNENKSYLGSVKIIANIANKKQKAAPRLGFRVGVFAQKNSQQFDNLSDKSTAKKSAKLSFTFFFFWCIKISATQRFTD